MKGLPAIKSLTPGKFEWYFRYLIFQIISVIDGWGISCELAIRWMSINLNDEKSTLVQVMAWCRQATSHYLSQCWPRSMSSRDVASSGHKELKVASSFNSHVNGLVQDCNISIANILEILQSSTKPLMWPHNALQLNHDSMHVRNPLVQISISTAGDTGKLEPMSHV